MVEYYSSGSLTKTVDQSQLSHEETEYCSSGSVSKTKSFMNCTTVGDDQSQLLSHEEIHHRPTIDVTFRRSWSLIILLVAMLMSMQGVSGSCKAGSYPYHNITRGEVCKLCPVGSYSFAAQNNCTTCAPGSFTAKVGTSAPCPCCPGGKYSSSITGSTTCSPCASGQWSNACSTTCSSLIVPGPTYPPTGQPTIQPTANPTNPTGQPTHQPTQQVHFQ